MITLFTVNGAAADCWSGYQADLARVLTDPWNDVVAQFWGEQYRNKYRWQPIGYDSKPVPMRPGIDQGVREHVHQLLLSPGKFAGAYYSEGSIIGSIVLDLLRGVKNEITARFTDLPDITHRYPDFLGAVTFGFPRREKGHTIPGGIDPGGHGIVTPNLVDTPASWWDFAAGKNMVGSPGQDLYTTCGYRGNEQSVADEVAVWKIVETTSFKSVLGLAEKVADLVPNPVEGGVAAVIAILDALDFFVLHGLTPHTSYQFTQPVAGDPRDCWRMGLDYLASLVGQSLL